MQHLDEGTIHAWLDGALSPDETARAEAHVGSCSMCAAATAEARGLIAASSRILTALDNVPSIRGAKGAKGAKGAGGAGGAGRRSLSTWLVREKIAAVMTLVVAGGALALVMSRDTEQAALVDLGSEPIGAVELAAADSPAPPAVVPEVSEPQRSANLRAKAEVIAPSPRPRDMTSGRSATPPPAPSIGQKAPAVIAMAAPVSTPPTNDSLRSVTVAEAERAEAQAASAQRGSSVAGRIGEMAARRRAADAPARLAEPRTTAQGFGAAAGAAHGPPEAPRLVQEENMVEGGREVRRRIYRVDGILVTLDEWSPAPAREEVRVQSANAPRDSTAAGTTIRWTDASGREFTLTGAAPTERLERIRKLLGLGSNEE